MEENEFKMTYYIGPMLAQGGILTILEDHLVFVPGTLEKALGAEDTVIPFSAILLVDVTGVITESLIIKTQEKIHRFVGGNLHAIKDKINAAIYKSVPRKNVVLEEQAKEKPATLTQPPAAQEVSKPTQAHSSSLCPTCAKAVLPEFLFCPFCKTILAKSCFRCFRKVQADWKYCAFCGNLL